MFKKLFIILLIVIASSAMCEEGNIVNESKVFVESMGPFKLLGSNCIVSSRNNR